MRRIWIVALREYRVTIRTKTFMMAMLLMPVFMGGSIGIQTLLKGRVDTKTKRVAVIDRSGKMFAALQDAVRRRNQQIVNPETGRQTESRYVLEEVMPDEEDPDRQLLALSQRVREKKLFAFVEIGPDILGGGADASDVGDAGRSRPAVRYYSNQPTYFNLRLWLQRTISRQVQLVRLTEADIDPALVQQAMQPVALDNLGLLDVDEAGHITQAEKVNEAITFGVPFGLTMLMFIALALTTQPLLNGVLEEKMQRIAEVLLGSVPPFELMLGKLIGYVGVAITLVLLYLTGGYIVAGYYGYADIVPAGLLAWFMVYQCLAILMFGSMFLAIGACCNDFREAQNLMLPVWLILCVPIFALAPVIEHPDSLFATLLSLFPPATPMLMIPRMAVPPGVPLWQPLVGIVGTVATTIVCVWAAGRIFRVGLLLSGKPPKITEMVRWAVRG